MNKKLIVGNWKMSLGYQQSIDLAKDLINDQPDQVSAEVIVCPSSVALAAVAEQLASTSIAWGAQDLVSQLPGAVTGGTSLESLVELGAQAVILGHSERRQLFAETDQLINQKLAAVVQRSSLLPIICVGESLAERQTGQAEAVITRQIQTILANNDLADRRLAIAYEPIWAIGNGQTSSPQQVQVIHQLIRQLLSQLGIGSAKILYGGSVKPINASDLLSQPDVDGLLVGGASLVAQDFWAIVQA